MKIAMNLTILVLLALQGEMARASFDDYQRFRRGSYDFGFETRYEKTTANYLSSGNNYRALPYDQSFELLNFNLKAKYDLSRRSSWYSNLGIASSTSFGVDAKRTNSGVTDATLGYIYMPYNDTFDLLTDFSVLAPFNKISENTDTALNNEGVIQVAGILRLQKEFGWLGGFTYIGGLYRQTRSALLPWGVGVEVGAGPGWSFGGKIFGFQSITDDADTNTKTQRQIVNDRVNGGSLKFYAVNPSWIDSEASIKFQARNGWGVAGSLGTTLTGTNYAAGLHAGAAVLYAWDSEPRYYLKNSTSEDGLGSERKVPKFKEEVNDGVDQKLFEKKKKPLPPSSENEVTPEPPESNVTVRRVSPKEVAKAPVETGPEMQLKLRKSKRRARQ
jgi:hypothetical protein